MQSNVLTLFLYMAYAHSNTFSSSFLLFLMELHAYIDTQMGAFVLVEESGVLFCGAEYYSFGFAFKISTRKRFVVYIQCKFYVENYTEMLAAPIKRQSFLFKYGDEWNFSGNLLVVPFTSI